jgi:hypothetical protein
MRLPHTQAPDCNEIATNEIANWDIVSHTQAQAEKSVVVQYNKGARKAAIKSSAEYAHAELLAGRQSVLL